MSKYMANCHTKMNWHPARSLEIFRPPMWTTFSRPFTIGLSDSPECFCHFKVESPEHFFLDCFLFSLERQRLFDLIEHYVPQFKRLNKQQKLVLKLTGVNIENQALLSTNITLTKEVQQYILSTKTFTAMETEL